MSSDKKISYVKASRGSYRRSGKKEKTSVPSRSAPTCFSERICRALDIPPDIFPKESMITLRGRQSLTVCGSGKILCYTPEEIDVAMAGQVLCIRGKRLFCGMYRRGTLLVEGEILSLSFEGEQR